VFAPNQVLVADSSDSFLNELRTGRERLALVSTFSHASSGAAIRTAPNPIIEQDIVGERLLFDVQDYVTPMSISSLAARHAIENPFFLQRPLFILNGCETGTAGYNTMTNLSFAGVLISRGARGVLVTEAPVWATFAYVFGESVLKKLATGTDIGAAVRGARLDFLASGNPLGLIYTYYGNPDAKFISTALPPAQD
jgi:hypothetical protein